MLTYSLYAPFAKAPAAFPSSGLSAGLDGLFEHPARLYVYKLDNYGSWCQNPARCRKLDRLTRVEAFVPFEGIGNVSKS
jgi:hypothetical protein